MNAPLLPVWVVRLLRAISACFGWLAAGAAAFSAAVFVAWGAGAVAVSVCVDLGCDDPVREGLSVALIVGPVAAVVLLRHLRRRWRRQLTLETVSYPFPLRLRGLVVITPVQLPRGAWLLDTDAEALVLVRRWGLDVAELVPRLERHHSRPVVVRTDRSLLSLFWFLFWLVLLVLAAGVAAVYGAIVSGLIGFVIEVVLGAGGVPDPGDAGVMAALLLWGPVTAWFLWYMHSTDARVRPRRHR